MLNMHLNYKLDVGQLQDRYICQNKRPGLCENAQYAPIAQNFNQPGPSLLSILICLSYDTTYFPSLVNHVNKICW